MRQVIKDDYNPFRAQNKYGGGRHNDWFAQPPPVPVVVPASKLPAEQVVTWAWNSESYKPTPTHREQLDKIIADAAAAAEAERVRIADEAAAATAAEQAVAQKKLARHKQTPEEREANKEKRLLKLVGAVVVKCMSKHQAQMDHDMFKKHAKEVRLLTFDFDICVLH